MISVANFTLKGPSFCYSDSLSTEHAFKDCLLKRLFAKIQL